MQKQKKRQTEREGSFKRWLGNAEDFVLFSMVIVVVIVALLFLSIMTVLVVFCLFVSE